MSAWDNRAIYSLSDMPAMRARTGLFSGIPMNDYEVFLLADDDEFSLGTVREILNLEAVTSLATIFADMISDLAFNLEDQSAQTFKIELRSPDGL